MQSIIERSWNGGRPAAAGGVKAKLLLSFGPRHEPPVLLLLLLLLSPPLLFLMSLHRVGVCRFS